jgi:hypothetical protein
MNKTTRARIQPKLEERESESANESPEEKTNGMGWSFFSINKPMYVHKLTASTSEKGSHFHHKK